MCMCTCVCAYVLYMYISVEKRGKDGLHKISGFENWKCESASKHVSEVFNKEEIVYLTAESNTGRFVLVYHASAFFFTSLTFISQLP